MINKQINMELYASYVYMAMACYFDRDDVALNGFLNILENNTSSTHVLIRNQFLSVFTFLGRVVGKTLGKSFEGNIITVKITSHGHVDIASVELHVDLLVNHSLGVGVKVDPDTGSHFSFLDNLEVFFLKFQKVFDIVAFFVFCLNKTLFEYTLVLRNRGFY